MCDPEAAKITFEGLKGIHALGADVTHKLCLTEEDSKRISEYGGASLCERYVSELYKMWQGESGRAGVLHDPLVIYYAKDASVCKLEENPVAVIIEGPARGMTLNVNAYTKAYMNPSYADFDLSHTHLTAKEVDRELMIKEFMRCFEE